MSNLIAQVIALLLTVETGGEPAPDRAYGDGGDARGCLQIHAIAVAEANRLAGYERWTLSDRMDRSASIAMARITLAHHYRRGYRDEVGLACRWNRPYSSDNLTYRARVEAVLAESRVSERQSQ